MTPCEVEYHIHKEGGMDMKKIALAVVSAMMVLACTACASEPAAQEGAGEVSEPAALTAADLQASASGVIPSSEWAKIYPEICTSFKDGENVIRENGKVYSHAAMGAKTEPIVVSYEESGEAAGDCMSCRSYGVTQLYDEIGTDAYGKTYSELGESLTEYWDCYFCHENDPENTLTTTISHFNDLTGEWGANLDPGIAVCAQCHSGMGLYVETYAGRRAHEFDSNDFTQFDIYKNGMGPEAMRQAFLDAGGALKVDEETGAEWTALYPEAEFYEGGTHYELGITCVDCHMQTIEAADGTTYTDHDASGRPSDKAVALEYCLTCHEAQGIESVADMRAFISGKTDEYNVMNDELQAKMDELHALLVEAVNSGNVDEETLDKARQAWADGKMYITYAGQGSLAGSPVAHNFDMTVECIDKGMAAVEEGIALLS